MGHRSFSGHIYCFSCAVFDNLFSLLQQDLSSPAPSSSTSTRPLSTFKPTKNPTECSKIQKDCLWHSLGTVHNACLLSPLQFCVHAIYVRCIA